MPHALLPHRILGTQGLRVPAMGLGCFTMANPYGPADDAESLATLHRALELGCNFFDTAESYGPFTNEELLGRAFAGRRDDIVIATKFGYPTRKDQPLAVHGHSRPEAIRASVDGSLRRLRTDHIDLLYQHRIDPAVPMEDVAGTVRELIGAGKVRYFGLSEAGVANIRRAHAVCAVSAVQSEYSLWERNLEGDVIPALRALGIGLVPYSPLGRGFLAGNARRAEEYPENDFRRDDPRYQGANFDANMQAAQVVRDMAAGLQATPAQIALAWLLHKGPDVVPIPGTKRRTYLEENLAAATIVLSPARMQSLDASLSPEKIAGPRYGEKRMSMIDR
ncbi:MAG TPA: aldo/keto reductase [Phycisphaerae bacterium]|nr:aldo/keto reductase [Phycisphaerae bacterium]